MSLKRCTLKKPDIFSFTPMMMQNRHLIALLVVSFSLSTSSQTPPGCTCKQSDFIDGQQCEQFDCHCKCDLTAGVCDINCCCDPECHLAEIASFGSCLDEGSVSPISKLCVEGASQLEDINLKYPFRISDSPEVSRRFSRFVNIFRIIINSTSFNSTKRINSTA